MTRTFDAIQVLPIGGPTALLEIGGLRLLTDPTFSPPGDHVLGPGLSVSKTTAPSLAVGELGPIDAVLLSHDQHPDNLDATGRELLETVPLVVTTPTAAARLGGSAVGLADGEHLLLDRPHGGTLRVEAVPAEHGPPGSEPIVGPVTGFVLSAADLPTVYISGDNASLDVVRAVRARMGPIDVALLFAGAARLPLLDGAPLTLTASDAARAVRELDVSVVVPLHIDGWSHLSEGLADVQRAFEIAGVAERISAGGLVAVPPRRGI